MSKPIRPEPDNQGGGGVPGGRYSGGKSKHDTGLPKKGFRDLNTEDDPIYRESIEEEDSVIMKAIKLFLEGQR